MDSKDWVIVALLLAAVGGPLGVHFFHTKQRAGFVPSGGKLSDTPAGLPAIDDGRRIGAAIGQAGGRAVSEAAKAAKQGSKVYGSREHAHEHMQVGGSA